MTYSACACLPLGAEVVAAACGTTTLEQHSTFGTHTRPRNVYEGPVCCTVASGETVVPYLMHVLVAHRVSWLCAVCAQCKAVISRLDRVTASVPSHHCNSGLSQLQSAIYQTQKRSGSGTS